MCGNVLLFIYDGITVIAALKSIDRSIAYRYWMRRSISIHAELIVNQFVDSFYLILQQVTICSNFKF